MGGSSASADPGSAVSVVCCTAHTGLMSREKSRSTVRLEFLGGLSQRSSAASRAVWGDHSCQGLVFSVPFCFAVSCECYLKFSRVRGKFITWSSFPGGPQCLGYTLLPDFWFLIWYMAPILREPQTQGTWHFSCPLGMPGCFLSLELSVQHSPDEADVGLLSPQHNLSLGVVTCLPRSHSLFLFGL